MGDNNNQKNKPQHESLSSLLRYLVGLEDLLVECKSGRMIRGKLLAAEDSMTVVLENAVCIREPGGHSQQPNADRSGSRHNIPQREETVYSMVQIRGSTIRYIHFPDAISSSGGDNMVASIIKQGMD
jgi:small nuclear ribonucleoprotein (snRNP)-like protein